MDSLLVLGSVEEQPDVLKYGRYIVSRYQAYRGEEKEASFLVVHTPHYVLRPPITPEMWELVKEQVSILPMIRKREESGGLGRTASAIETSLRREAQEDELPLMNSSVGGFELQGVSGPDIAGAFSPPHAQVLDETWGAFSLQDGPLSPVTPGTHNRDPFAEEGWDVEEDPLDDETPLLDQKFYTRDFSNPANRKDYANQGSLIEARANRAYVRDATRAFDGNDWTGHLVFDLNTGERVGRFAIGEGFCNEECGPVEDEAHEGPRNYRPPQFSAETREMIEAVAPGFPDDKLIPTSQIGDFCIASDEEVSFKAMYKELLLAELVAARALFHWNREQKLWLPRAPDSEEKVLTPMPVLDVHITVPDITSPVYGTFSEDVQARLRWRTEVIEELFGPDYTLLPPASIASGNYNETPRRIYALTPQGVMTLVDWMQLPGTRV